MAKKKFSEEVRFEKNYQKMALIVQLYGEVYMPLFKLMHEEKVKRKVGQDLKSIALQVAQSALK